MNDEEREALSIDPLQSHVNLANNASDRTASALKGLVGAVPFVGSILQEAVSVVIPNQRVDRVVLTMECFAQKIAHMEEDVLKAKMLTEEFTDLLEDAIPQAARSLSEERREYIASFLKNSLTSEELDHVHEKKLLSILGELNDAEIIFLRHNSLNAYEKQKEGFFEKHLDILAPVKAVFGSPRHDLDKRAMRDSFQEKLIDEGLVRRKFVQPQPGSSPEMDQETGMLKSKYIVITQLGRALLRYIDQPASTDKAEDELHNSRSRMAEN